MSDLSSVQPGLFQSALVAGGFAANAFWMVDYAGKLWQKLVRRRSRGTPRNVATSGAEGHKDKDR